MEKQITLKKKTEEKDSIEWRFVWSKKLADDCQEKHLITIDESTTESHLEVWVEDAQSDELIDHGTVAVNTRGKVRHLYWLMESVSDCLQEMGFKAN
jgi:hypothetical protein